MYTKGTQTVQSKNEDFVPPPYTLPDTPTKSQTSHISSPPHHHQHQQKQISSEKGNESKNVNEKLEDTNEREQEVISIVEPHRIVFLSIALFSSFTISSIDCFYSVLLKHLQKTWFMRVRKRRMLFLLLMKSLAFLHRMNFKSSFIKVERSLKELSS
jgi:hypothetical protein